MDIEGERRNHEFEVEVSRPGWCRRDYTEEAKRQLWLAGPLVGVSLLQYCLQVISVMFVGHLGERALSSASMASSFAAVTGFSVLLGMGSALETLCGQAYGAKQYHMLGIQTQKAMLILLAIGQDHEIPTGAGTFSRWMIPALFVYGLLQCLNRFLQTQNKVFRMLVTSGITAILHIFVCWGLVFKAGLGSKGAALGNVISNWLNVFLLALYVKLSPSCIETWTGFSKEALHNVLSFVKLAISSAIMICLEYWSLEMVVLLSGLLPNPKLETSVLSISMNTCWMVYMISVGLGGAISTRVSNELGAGHPQASRRALYVMIVMAVTEDTVVGLTTILVRHVWGNLYSKEAEVIRYVARMMPLPALSDFLDGSNAFSLIIFCTGAARGCGWQKACVFINLGAYYCVAIPCAAVFAFVLHIGGMGLWMGIICGLAVQIVALITVNACADWDKVAKKAISRVGNGTVSEGNGAVWSQSSVIQMTSMILRSYLFCTYLQQHYKR